MANLRPYALLIFPPWLTSTIQRLLLMDSINKRIFPSSVKMGSPSFKSLIISGVVNVQHCAFPTIFLSDLIENLWPVSNITSSFSNDPTLIFGPCRSKKIAVCLFNSSETFRISSISSLIFSLFRYESHLNESHRPPSCKICFKYCYYFGQLDPVWI